MLVVGIRRGLKLSLIQSYFDACWYCVQQTHEMSAISTIFTFLQAFVCNVVVVILQCFSCVGTRRSYLLSHLHDLTADRRLIVDITNCFLLVTKGKKYTAMLMIF